MSKFSTLALVISTCLAASAIAQDSQSSNSETARAVPVLKGQIINGDPPKANLQRPAPTDQTEAGTLQPPIVNAPQAVQDIVATREFKRAVKSKNIARMNKLLADTGFVASEPVALFYCKSPQVPKFINGAWYCSGGGITIKVEPFMYAD